MIPTVRRKIQDIVLPAAERFKGCSELFFGKGRAPVILEDGGRRTRSDDDPVDVAGLRLDAAAGTLGVDAGTTVTFATYLNACSIGKWLTYTCAERVGLRLRVKGDFSLRLRAYFMHDLTDPQNASGIEMLRGRGMTDRVLEEVPITSDGTDQIEYLFPDIGAVLVGFELEAHGDCTFLGGHYFAEADADSIRKVDLSLITCTFRKEEFITRTIDLLKDEVFARHDELAAHLRVFVIDHGRTLDPERLGDANIAIVPNDNVGGAGGFARGMIEVLRSDKPGTHVLLMDDDVLLLAESLRRTYSLLTLLKPEYQGRFISGAMLKYEMMHIQHEDVGFVHDFGFYFSKKGDRNLRGINVCCENEVDWADFGNEYAAWWYCCIPMRYINERNLPLPLFVRGDDVEFSLRNDPGFITLNGICVWHVGFEKKYNASVELYQVIRNSFIIQAASDVCRGADFIGQAEWLYRYQISQLAYGFAELLLDALEDYLKGPAYLEGIDGAEVLREKSDNNERLIPLDEIPEAAAVDLDTVYDDVRRTPLQRLLHHVTYNGHTMPAACLDDSLGTTPFDHEVTPGKQLFRKRILAVNPYEHTGCMRTRDDTRYRALDARKRELFRRYVVEHEQIERLWRARADYLETMDFWTDYLGL